MTVRLVECVPNFSEGKDRKIIDAIADAITSVSGIRLLDVDPGKSTNRTVMTFVGSPETVVEAAFQGIARAAQLIDMRKHTGEHPRMGATDVCPFVPVTGVSMEDCVKLARELGERVGKELSIPVYLYAEAASKPSRRSLAEIRHGEYEGLETKMKNADFAPDFGPGTFNAHSGATVIGARHFLIAYNVNLNTRSKKLANEIALNIREAGRAKRDEKGEIVKDANGETVKVAGSLKECRAVGWYVDEYERAQVSINLTNFEVTGIERAFDEVVKEAEKLGVRVTGSEIVGLVPLKPMLHAGEHYLKKQGRSTGVPEEELISCAVQSLGLSELSPFKPAEKIVEYTVQTPGKHLRDLSLTNFVHELASESPAPGGGSVAALCGCLSASLSSMVANLTFEKKGMEPLRPDMEKWAKEAQAMKRKLLYLVDEDMQAFNGILEARRLPKNTQEERHKRDNSILAANCRATIVPLSMLKMVPELLTTALEMVEKGNPSSLSDAGVAALTALACGEGAYFNVLINLSGLGTSEEEVTFNHNCRVEADQLIKAVRAEAEKIRALVLSRIS